MSTDRPPTDGPAAGDAPWAEPVEPTRPIQPLDATQPIPAEPTQPIPHGPDPQPFAGSWASGPAEWPAPDQAQMWRPQGYPGDGSQPYPGEVQDPQQARPPADQAPQQPYPQPFPGNPQPFPSPGQQGGWPNLAQPGQPAGTFVGGQQGWGPPSLGTLPGWGQPAGPPSHWAAAPPPPLAGYPPPAAPPPRGRGWLVALLTLAMVVVVSLIAALAVPVLADLPTRRGGPTALPSTSAGGSATPQPSASSPTPAPTPTPSMPTDSKVLLKKNPIYRLKVPANCGYQAVPASQAAFRKQVRSLVSCENVAWKKALSTTPVRFTKPKVKFYSTSVKTPCGKLGTTFPASYCTSDSTIYFSRASYLQGRFYRLSVAHFVMHEYAHHVQSLAGILGATWAMKESSAVTSRRVELQAHCIAHYGLTVSGVGLSARDNRSIEYQWDYSNDPKGHGSTAAERYWGQRGLDATTLRSCNTWTAKTAKVK